MLLFERAPVVSAAFVLPKRIQQSACGHPHIDTKTLNNDNTA